MGAAFTPARSFCVSVQAYLDASVGPSADALLFFEHLLKPSLDLARAQLAQERAAAS